MTEAVKVRHPATFSAAVLDAIVKDAEFRLPLRARVLDPFAGVGKVHGLPYQTTGIELEPEWATVDFWAASGRESICGDSLAWMKQTRRRFHAVVTSPVYGNRMSDHHDAKDKCKFCAGTGLSVMPNEEAPDGIACPRCEGSGLSLRRSYRHDLGRMPTEGSSAVMHYGPAYREFHRRAWGGVFRVLEPGGFFYLNVKDFVRNHRRVHVSRWHRETCERIGFQRVRTIRVPTPGMRYGQNHAARAGAELVYVFQKPEGA